MGDPFTEKQIFQRHFDSTGPEMHCSEKLSLTIIAFSSFCGYELCNPFLE
jgi:hypothetical protein